MPTKRFEMPNGDTYRTNSKKRYIVVGRGPTSPWITAYRTDQESVALAKWRHEAHICEAAHLLDTTTGEVIR